MGLTAADMVCFTVERFGYGNRQQVVVVGWDKNNKRFSFWEKDATNDTLLRITEEAFDERAELVTKFS